jgi:hypothetical protein
MKESRDTYHIKRRLEIIACQLKKATRRSAYISETKLYLNFSRDKICPVPEKLSKSEKKNQSDISALKLALLEVGIITKLSKYLFIPVHWDKRKAANGF